MENSKKTNFLGLPEKVEFCKKCVISNQRPSSVVEFKNKQEQAKPTIKFDEENVCIPIDQNFQIFYVMF